MIVPTKGGKYIVKSESGKNLSKPLSKRAAVKRLQQVEHFKHKKAARPKRESASEMIARGAADRRFI